MWEKESKIAYEAIREVAPLLMDVPRRSTIQTKTSARDLVTELDISVEKHLTIILETLPHEILGEETYYRNRKLMQAPYWCVDPIDGTLNFISGIPLYGTSLGLFDGTFVTGAISLPKLNEYYYIKDNRAWLNDRALLAQPSVLKDALIVDCFLGSATQNGDNTHQWKLHEALLQKSRGVLRLGSVAAGLAFLAADRVQGIIGRRCEIWDAAAGIAIATHAGYKTWFQLQPDSTKIDFMVAAPGVMEPIFSLVSDHKLMEA